MTDREIIKTLVNVIEPQSVTEEALKQICVSLLEEEKPKEKTKTAPVKTAPAKEPAEPKKKPGRKPIDWPKAEACRNAGWSIPMIADELNVSDQTVRNHFKMLEV